MRGAPFSPVQYWVFVGKLLCPGASCGCDFQLSWGSPFALGDVICMYLNGYVEL